MRTIFYKNGNMDQQAQPICVTCNRCQATVIEDDLSDGAGKALV